ncbi:MAG: aminotransferase class I/II-fold pyridoxal phosphate-dependent enzyme [Desulfovibrionaceae bacterium]|nr:aminotransferase class I/II-fold pyridoxal phosphate-dependent enzyme [Desulfovibrionaceae bacterium]
MNSTQNTSETPSPVKQEASGSYSKVRSKLAFDRLVALGEKMGMESPLFLNADRAAKATIHIKGKDYINFSTYDYLDINTHPEITAAVVKAAEIFGTSAGASRLVGGERSPHRLLENAISEFLGTEDCIVYVSGHATNVSTLGFLFGARDLILYDNLAHNSLAQGARLSGAARFAYAHNDCDDLERLLKAKRADHKRAVIVTEGLFSMDGNISDIPRLIELKKQYDCMLMVDEAHSFGTIGEHGGGVREYFNVDPNDIDLWMSTLSKTLCGCGGYIAGRKDLIEHLKHGSPGFVFSVGLSPVLAVASYTALQIMKREPERVHRLQHISQYFLAYAKEKGLNTGESQGYAIVPIITGESMMTGFLATQLFSRGIYVMPITFPAVKEGEARLRFFLSASQTEENVRKTIDALVEEMPKAQAIVDEYRAAHPEGSSY